MKFSIHSEKWDTDIDYTAEITKQGYFSLTGESVKKFRRYEPIVCGCLHDELKDTLWEKYVKWHLFYWGKGPLHYVANALYHLGYTKPYTKPDFDTFLDQIVWGESYLDTDEALQFLLEVFNASDNDETYEVNKELVTQFLQERLPSLNKRFESAMVEMGVLEVKK